VRGHCRQPRRLGRAAKQLNESAESGEVPPRGASSESYRDSASSQLRFVDSPLIMSVRKLAGAARRECRFELGEVEKVHVQLTLIVYAIVVDHDRIDGEFLPIGIDDR
jgi:hypothetical protein